MSEEDNPNKKIKTSSLGQEFSLKINIPIETQKRCVEKNEGDLLEFRKKEEVFSDIYMNI